MSDKPVAKTPDVREELRKVVMSCFYLESWDCPVERNPACKQCDDWMDRIYSKVIQPLIEAAKTEERARILKRADFVLTGFPELKKELKDGE